MTDKAAPDRDPIELIARPDPTFKMVTEQIARAQNIKVIGAELPQLLSADLILDMVEAINLSESLFSFLQAYRYAVTDFKGPRDPLDMPKLQLTVARTALFTVKTSTANERNTVNLLVCSRYPQKVLKEPADKDIIGFKRPDPTNRPWLWQGRYLFQEIIVVVCRDLPIEERYFEWLLFVPPDNQNWPDTIKAFRDAARNDLITTSIKLHPKEFDAMSTKIDINWDEYLDSMSEQEREEHYDYLSEVVGHQLSRVTRKRPDLTKKFFKDFETEQVISGLSEEQRAGVIESTDADKVADILNAEQRVKAAQRLTDEELLELLRQRHLQDKSATDKN